MIAKVHVENCPDESARVHGEIAKAKLPPLDWKAARIRARIFLA
jgi:hypothetical protein